MPGHRQYFGTQRQVSPGETSENPIPLHELIAFVSHELRSPISTLQAFLNVLSSEQPGSLNEVQRDFTYSMLTVSKRLERLVDDMDTLSAGERGLSNHPRSIDVLSLLHDCALEIAAIADGYAVSVEINVPEDEEWRQWIDPVRFSQIVINLLENAVRNSVEGSVVHTRLRQSKTRLLLIVENDAADEIGEEEIRNWFMPFVRGAGAGARSPQGSGLGLAVVAHLTAILGGRVFARASDRRVTIGVQLPRQSASKVAIE